MIGDSVYKEKHWDRNDTISTCFQLSPESAFSISNRWKDRSVGWSERLIYPLAHSAIDSNYTTSASLWALSSFSWEYGLSEFLSKCLAKEPSKLIQQGILDYYIRDLRIKGYCGDKWIDIHKLAIKYKLECITVEEVKLLAVPLKTDNSGTSPKNSTKPEAEEYQWDKLYGEFDLLTDVGFNEVFQFYENQGYSRESEKFWQGCYKKTTSRKLSSFLNVISQSEKLDFYDLHNAFKQIPESWKNKVSVKNSWNTAIKYIASRFPQRFTEIYERDYFLGGFIINENTNTAIKEGVIKGLSNSVDIESARALFSFAHYSASNLTITEAQDLIDYGLSRLEKFLDEDYADGSWNEQSQLPKDLPHAVASYIYANLGSPHAEERWRAVHAVTRLYNLNCKNEINLLIECYSKGLTQSFIPTKYEFYDLHAKQYLLVALTRCANDCPELLVNNKSLFATIALNKNQGILFQYYAKKICLLLQQYSSDCFEKSTYEKIEKACITQYSTINEKQYSYQTDTPWHKADTLGVLSNVWFAHDFDRYWFAPLGRVFGVSSSQVQDLAKNILSNLWGMELKSSHLKDSRAELWRGRRNSRDTSHSHSSYPNIDDYSFYISYHLLLEVASQLLESMPVIHDEDYDVNCWEEWLNRHLILNKDHLLLSELRDAIPVRKSDWINEEYNKDWLWQISETDFIEHLIVQDNSSTWLNVEGSWDEYKDSRNEHVTFSSVLVPKELSQSLLLTTINFDNHMHECYLYNYCESDYGHRNSENFQCKEWLIQEGEHNDIESNDPNVGTIYAQPYKLRKHVTELINVTSSVDEKTFSLSSDHSICLKNKYWSEDKPSDSDSYVSSGKPALASLKFLQLICDKLNVDIAIQVNIKRTFTGSYRNKDDKLGYIPRYSKTFILSGDGKLRDTRKSYQLR
ncbi:MAG: hypothetical protein COA59_16630 [Colwellia sp.]|nr:MAG: hypothetical protein COA59_16630 [Colwellia sp.]